jgi:hypothetical protein
MSDTVFFVLLLVGLLAANYGVSRFERWWMRRTGTRPTQYADERSDDLAAFRARVARNRQWIAYRNEPIDSLTAQRAAHAETWGDE